jgi:hypothetical protein
MQGLKHQLSQGAGGWTLNPGPHYAFYKLIDSVLPSTTDSSAHEKDYWDGIDTAFSGLANRLGQEQSKAPFLRPALVQLQNIVAEATAAANRDPQSATAPLLTGLEAVRSLQKKVEACDISAAAKNAVLPDLITKEQQFEQAADLAAGATLNVTVDAPVAPNPEDAFMAVPKQSFTITAKFAVAAPAAKLNRIALDLPRGWTSEALSLENGGTTRFRISVPVDAKYTRPYWHRDDPQTQSVNIVDDPRYITLPFPPPPLAADAIYTLNGKTGTVHATVMTKYMVEGVERERAVAVAPPFSIALEPTTDVISTGHTGTTEITVGVRSDLASSASANLRLELPSGWSAEPASQAVSFQHAGESKDFHFKVKPADLHEARHQISALVEYQGKPDTLGYTVITRPDLDSFYYYQPAVQRVSIVDVKVPQSLKVAYIMGAGDDIPTVLQQIGIDITLLPAEKIVSEDLSRYATVILGIRAYDTQKELVSNNKKLLDYVSNGGTLIVQYETDVSDFNSEHLMPYPAQLSRARVSVEQAPVEILSPDDPLLHYPNQITAKDFEAWVQERGLYFMDQWDDHFRPLLSCHDPGEPQQKGGLLVAQYGKGTYIYNAYAFFRQLPAGVPGAIRLYVNLLSAGHH